ncbi:protein kinase [Nonomuraea angiospora]|uniref:non-specific serine/threonine protein kinase n=1 Tax=Nonomuraea angiospora TaxID=46172 RepID=A0ABR9LY74_9ACTN|nr:serine/threonine-protein kinase [Nonomuraea angiospora]MBE1585593.1 serine/threonine protein kinase [Nonomuraea angiospora]
MLPVEDAPGYRVLDQAGQGGFAVVYRAYQERLDRVVALKVLSVDRVDQRTMRRFQRELQLTGRLTGHPNVVTVFDTGVTRSGKPYIAMDYFENGSLRDKVRKEGPLQVPDVLRAGVKLAGALAAVHEAGVLHGDIKPQNILISRYGEVAIADFGVARVVDSSEISATSQAFTPLHAAPEVLTGQPHSASTDIYSLGSTLYHLLAGQPAFHNPTDPSIAPLMYRVLSVEPPPINRSDVPPPVLETVLRAMSKQPEVRYGSAREFARRLQEVQAELGLPVTDLVGQDPGPGPAMSTVPRPRLDDPPTAEPQHQGSPQPPGSPQHPGSSQHLGSPQLPTTGNHLPSTGHHLPGGPGRPSPFAPEAQPSPFAPDAQPSPFAPEARATGTGAPYATGRHAPGIGGLPEGGPPGAQGPGTGGAQGPGVGGGQGPGVGGGQGPGVGGGPSGYHAAGASAPPSVASATTPPAHGATTAPGGGGRLPRGLVIGAAVAAVVVGGTSAAVYLSLQQNDPSHTTQPSASEPGTRDTEPIDKQSVAALTPRGLKVTADQGALVELKWTLPAGARRYPVVLQRSPIKKGEQAITALAQGTTATRVAGLDPDSGYCFLVGVPLRISESSTVAWSKPTCIRGAVARSNP